MGDDGDAVRDCVGVGVPESSSSSSSRMTSGFRSPNGTLRAREWEKLLSRLLALRIFASRFRPDV